MLKRAFMTALVTILMAAVTTNPAVAKNNKNGKVKECVEACDRALKKADERIESLKDVISKKDDYIEELEKSQGRLQEELMKEKEVEWHEDPSITVPGGMMLGILLMGFAT